MGVQRYVQCGRCGGWHYGRPMYERVYDRGGKSGRFVRAFWLCEECFDILSGAVVQDVQVPTPQPS